MGKTRWLGNVSEVTRGKPWAINAEGKSREALTRPALDAAGDPTVNPSVAIANAGLSWLTPSGFLNANFGTVEPAKVNYLDALLNDSTKAEGKKWAVWADGYAIAATDPTSPSWLLNAADLEIGVVDERRYDRVIARYVSAIDIDGNPSTYDTVSVGSAGRTYIMDLTPLLLLDAPTATTYAQAQLNEFSIPAWTSRVTVANTNLRTVNGIPADLADVRAGQMVSLWNVPLTLGRTRTRMATDVVLGEVEWVDGASEITLAPLNLAVRNLVDEIAARSPARSMAS